MSQNGSELSPLAGAEVWTFRPFSGQTGSGRRI